MKKLTTLTLILILESNVSFAAKLQNSEPLNPIVFLLLLFGIPLAISYIGYGLYKSSKEVKKRLSKTPEQKAAQFLNKELNNMRDDYLKK
jgi:hypothetical protein